MSYKKTIKKILNLFGYQLQKNGGEIIAASQNKFSMRSALERCRNRGLIVNTVIDVGASDGRWSRDCMAIFPDINYLLIEAQEVHRRPLENFKSKNSKVEIILAAAASRKAEVYFDASDPFGGVASEIPFENGNSVVPSIVLDEEVERLELQGPYLLKLDTHGFEIPILKGANGIIRKASLIIVETYNFKLTNQSLRYWEMCAYMDSIGFSPIENVDFMLRKSDFAFWQMDSFFIPSNNRIFLNTSYEI